MLRIVAVVWFAIAVGYSQEYATHGDEQLAAYEPKARARPASQQASAQASIVSERDLVDRLDILNYGCDAYHSPCQINGVNLSSFETQILALS